MRRPLLSLAAAAALATVLTACGGDDGGGDAGGCTPADAEVTVHALDALKFDADAYDSDAGCIEVSYVNDGSVAHTLLVKGKSGFKLSVGDTDSGTVELPAGTYELYCDVAGHEAAGMKADLEVS
jgi:plastocyanin